MCDCRKLETAARRFAPDPRLRFGCCQPDPCDPCGGAMRRAFALVDPVLPVHSAADWIRWGIR